MTARAVLTAEAAPRAACAGDARDGAALIVSPLYGPFVEVLAVAWGNDGVDGVVEPLVHHEDVDVVWARLESRHVLLSADEAEVRELLTDACWHALRAGGRVPEILASRL
jgi:hypothetical protein